MGGVTISLMIIQPSSTASRIFNVLGAAGLMRGASRIASAYCGFREAFGSRIGQMLLVADAEERIRRQREADSIAAVRAETEAVRAMIARRVHFDFDKYDIRPGEDTEVMEEKLAIMQANPSLRLEITGHADERGTDEYNMALGMRRSNSAKQFMVESGRIPPEQGDQMVDRIANIPGQLTAYDSGGLEIFALRRQAEEALGEAFDIREFHDRVLENGSIPLWMLRRNVEAWIAENQ